MNDIFVVLGEGFRMPCINACMAGAEMDEWRVLNGAHTERDNTHSDVCEDVFDVSCSVCCLSHSLLYPLSHIHTHNPSDTHPPSPSNTSLELALYKCPSSAGLTKRCPRSS
jgi:hypothetical protein